MFERQLVALIAAVAIASASLAADVTIATTIKMEGAAAGMMAGKPAPRMVTRIKGMKARTDVDTNGTTSSSIADVADRRVIILNSQEKTAQVLDGSPVAPGKTLPAPEVDVTVKPTGKTRTIQGIECAEHAFTVLVSMGDMMSGAQVPPEAAAMMEGVSMRMDGSVWSATTGPGAAEYMALTKAAIANDLAGMLSGAMGMTGGLETVMTAAMNAPGIPYLTEMTLTLEGASEMAQMMRQMGSMNMTMEVTSVSTDPIPDSLFEIPAGYQVIK